MKVTIANTIRIESPTPAVIEWCQMNLVLANPEFAKRLRMGLYTGRTPKTISLYEIVGNSYVLPFGTIRELLPLLKNAEIRADFVDSEPVDYKADVGLYDYQKAAVEACIKKKYGILKSPAGSGKTQMGIALIAALGRRALWLTHTQDLLKQSYDRAAQYIDKSLLAVTTAGQTHIGKGITFATVQTLSKLDLTQYRDYWDTIIVDECHRVCKSSNAASLFYKVLNGLSARHKYGLSATVHRADGLIEAVYAMIGHEAYVVPDEAVEGKTMKVTIKAISTDIGISRECLGTDGMINFAKTVNYLCADPCRNDRISNAIASQAGHSCLILSDRLEHLKKLMELLPPELRRDAVMVSGDMVTKKAKQGREQAIEDMRQGKKHFLFATYSLCKEGLDIPRLDRLFLTTPQKDYAVITQSIGRIARTFEGKEPPVCYDFVDDIYLMHKFWKQRCTTYRKNGCVFG